MPVDRTAAPERPIIIGVAGGSGSGKTSVVLEIIDRFGAEHVARLQHDWYYFDRSDVPPPERVHINYDHPASLETALLVTHLRQLRNNQPIQAPVYDFANHTRRPETVTIAPEPVIIVEGILVLAEAALRDLMDIRVFVDTDADLRILRRLERDIKQRGRHFDTVVAQYLDTVRPMHLEFVEPSKRYAHVIIPEGVQNVVAVDMLTTTIESIVSGGRPSGPPPIPVSPD